MGNGSEEPIIVYPNDKAETLAEEFAKKHNMNYKMKEKLRRHIQESIDKVMIEIKLEQDDNPNIEDIKINYENSNVKNEFILPSANEGVTIKNLPVYERLHMQAVNKQRALQHSQDYCRFIH